MGSCEIQPHISLEKALAHEEIPLSLPAHRFGGANLLAMSMRGEYREAGGDVVDHDLASPIINRHFCVEAERCAAMSLTLIANWRSLGAQI